MNHSSIDGTSIRCTCCSRKKKLAELSPDGLEIINGRSGNLHRSQTTPLEIVEVLSGTQGAGVISWVEGLVRPIPSVAGTS